MHHALQVVSIISGDTGRGLHGSEMLWQYSNSPLYSLILRTWPRAGAHASLSYISCSYSPLASSSRLSQNALKLSKLQDLDQQMPPFFPTMAEIQMHSMVTPLFQEAEVRGLNSNRVLKEDCRPKLRVPRPKIRLSG
ncbi:uncharacterized protein LOC131164518 isoform X2 [Malania oleifera]|uniref:uncharacterized protein LOC131164518 isoform X2 n=1 Tax=Malania oleifera TaxID=397392 RepID=UPI0025ADEFD1|nr:uncharacterized protein LOC131164518 isoform X2 [Malania oleifera]